MQGLQDEVGKRAARRQYKPSRTKSENGSLNVDNPSSLPNYLASKYKYRHSRAECNGDWILL